MARIIVAGDSVVVESSFTLEELKLVEKYKQSALILMDNEGKNEVFRIATVKGNGSISKYGICFGSCSKDDNRRAVLTIEMPSDVTDVNAFVEDNIGLAILHLKKIEEGIVDALAEIEMEREAIINTVVIA